MEIGTGRTSRRHWGERLIVSLALRSADQSEAGDGVLRSLQDVLIDQDVLTVMRGMLRAVAIHLAASIPVPTVSLQRRLDDVHQERRFGFGSWDDNGDSERRHQHLHGWETLTTTCLLCLLGTGRAIAIGLLRLPLAPRVVQLSFDSCHGFN